MENKCDEAAREVVDLFRSKKLTIAEIRDVLMEVNETLDSISVIMEKPHTAPPVWGSSHR